MKLHPLLIQAVIHGLTEIFAQGKYADKVIESLLKSNAKWGARDRAFIAESIYEIVRYQRRYWAMAGMNPVYHASALWQIFGLYWVSKGYPLPDWKEFQRSKPADKVSFARLQSQPEIWESYPDWLNEMAKAELGEALWNEEMKALNLPAEVVMRVNTLKTTVAQLQKKLKEESIYTEKIPGYPDALLLTKRINIFRHPLFQAGFFEIQDASSQSVGRFTGVEPGMRVIDACAGAGGKTLHLAALMENKGKIIAMDVEEYKLQELRKRASRAGISIIETRKIESTKTLKRLYDSADCLLLDVPCSGTGVIRRNPDAKWKLSPEFIGEVREKQREILHSYTRMTAREGNVIYATCSILPSENEQQVKSFLNENMAFTLKEARHMLASREGFDGFYMAKMSRNI
ncbi:MAG: RsmB/NOP family class I SAM-dependent RNA methyltransferase [Bacteroidia bacterium]|nr:RsmB/NOP family class I SAM-dependent RNA methyltransferase [Bacteroidia bacterium]